MILISKQYMLGNSDQLDITDPNKLREDVDKVAIVNDVYQDTVKSERNRIQFEIDSNPIKAKSNNLKAFVFSENHIFGKFDGFVKRMQRLVEVYSSMQRLQNLKKVTVDGTEPIVKKVDQLQCSMGLFLVNSTHIYRSLCSFFIQMINETNDRIG